MKKIIRRLFALKLPKNRSAFLWGPRKVGKSYWITHTLKPPILIDFLKTDVFADYASRPSLLRERYQDHKGLLVIDEVQKIPAILDEVHWLIEHSALSFLLTGSSARKRIIRNIWFRALSSGSLQSSSRKVRRLPPGPLSGRPHNPASLV